MRSNNINKQNNWTRNGSDFFIDKEYKKDLIKNIKKYIYKDNLKNISIDQISHDVIKIISAYNKMVEAFKWKYRKISWERYFEHLREVANIVLKMPNPSIDKIVAALYHDSIEDLEEYNFEVVKNETWSEIIALKVEILSKKHWKTYSDDENLWKALRNKDYFWKLKSVQEMENHIKNLAELKWLKLNEEEIIEITINIFHIKFADRIHNLKTQWNPEDIKSVKIKIRETKKYFLTIAKTINPSIHIEMLWEIIKLETELAYTQKQKDKEYELSVWFKKIEKLRNHIKRKIENKS